MMFKESGQERRPTFGDAELHAFFHHHVFEKIYGDLLKARNRRHAVSEDHEFPNGGSVEYRRRMLECRFHAVTRSLPRDIDDCPNSLQVIRCLKTAVLLEIGIHPLVETDHFLASPLLPACECRREIGLDFKAPRICYAVLRPDRMWAAGT